MDFTKEELEYFLRCTMQSKECCEVYAELSVAFPEELDKYKEATIFWRQLELKLQHYLEEK